MPSKTALPIARLRSLGCRVSTIIGHDPAIGDFKYGVTLPVKPTPDLLMATHQQGNAVANFLDDGRVYVRATSYRMGQPIPDRSVRDANDRDVAGVLNAIADVLSKAGRS